MKIIFYVYCGCRFVGYMFGIYVRWIDRILYLCILLYYISYFIIGMFYIYSGIKRRVFYGSFVFY